MLTSNQMHEKKQTRNSWKEITIMGLYIWLRVVGLVLAVSFALSGSLFTLSLNTTFSQNTGNFALKYIENFKI